MSNLLKKEKQYYIITILVLTTFFMISMVQNVIRYGMNDGYNPWRTVLYLSISLLLFLLLLPVLLYVFKKTYERLNKQYWLVSVLFSVSIIIIFYFISGFLMYVLGFNDEFVSLKYARQYFGRGVLYHMVILAGTVFYVYNTSKKTIQKRVSGMLGRREVTIHANLIRWIEADDHYLKIHTQDQALIKRSSLEKMAKTLNPDFIRIHRKFLVNKSAIVSTERNQRDEYVILQSGKKLKVGRTYRPIEL